MEQRLSFHINLKNKLNLSNLNHPLLAQKVKETQNNFPKPQHIFPQSH
jgi:hypothetical protein